MQMISLSDIRVEHFLLYTLYFFILQEMERRNSYEQHKKWVCPLTRPWRNGTSTDSKIPDLVKKDKRLDDCMCLISDHGAMNGVVDFLQRMSETGDQTYPWLWRL